MSRMKDLYEKEVVPKLIETFKYKNVMEVPKFSKVVLNMGLGEAIQNVKILETATEELKAIAGQHPVITRAKKSIAAFKLREGMPIGCMVTLRQDADVRLPAEACERGPAARPGLPGRFRKGL